MAKRKGGGMGILPVVAVFLGLVAAGAGYGLFHFYNLYDQTQLETLPKMEEDLKKQKQLNEKMKATWNELAPWVLDAAKFQKPEDFESLDGRKAVDEQIVKAITTHFRKPDWGDNAENWKQFAQREKLRYGDVVTKLEGEVVSLKDQVKTWKEQAAAHKAELKTVLEDKDRQAAARRAEADKFSRDLAEKQRALDDANRLREARETERNQALAVVQGQLNKASQEKDREISELQNQNRDLNTKIKELTQVKDIRAAVLEKDGEITGASQSLGKAWINLGHRHRIQRGMHFTVFTMSRGGLPREKGKIEIRNVEEDFSAAGILTQVDDRDPIVAGDFVANPVYRPEESPRFVICGDPQTFNREDLIRLIEENGGKVLARISMDTNFLVVCGERADYEGQVDYREALQRGIPLMNEKQLLDYLPSYGRKP